MNNERRKAIKAAIELVIGADNARAEALEAVQAILSEEQEAFDNLPESMQQGERGERMQEAVNALEEAESTLDGWDASDVISALETASD